MKPKDKVSEDESTSEKRSVEYLLAIQFRLLEIDFLLDCYRKCDYLSPWRGERRRLLCGHCCSLCSPCVCHDLNEASTCAHRLI